MAPGLTAQLEDHPASFPDSTQPLSLFWFLLECLVSCPPPPPPLPGSPACARPELETLRESLSSACLAYPDCARRRGGGTICDFNRPHHPPTHPARTHAHTHTHRFCTHRRHCEQEGAHCFVLSPFYLFIFFRAYFQSNFLHPRGQHQNIQLIHKVDAGTCSF